MDIFSISERAMSMDAQSWARHASPKSVYSRIVGGSFVFLALWSVFWIGWYATIPITAALIWIYVNPRLFYPPTSTTAWAMRGVLGERVYLRRATVHLPAEHLQVAKITTGLALIFIALAAYGFIIRDFWTAAGGWHAATMAKLWFCDRMVWLWDDMADTNPTYRAWKAGCWDVETD